MARPSETVIVYLDLNHWIGLAQAVTGHHLGVRHQPVLEACREARSNGTAVFPLSDAHYVEVSKIKSPQQRRDLASVMEELSDFTTLLARLDVMRIELVVLGLSSRGRTSADLLVAQCQPRPLGERGGRSPLGIMLLDGAPALFEDGEGDALRALPELR